MLFMEQIDVKKSPVMQELSGVSLKSDELYIFSRKSMLQTDDVVTLATGDDILWGVVENADNDVVHLESCTEDLENFKAWVELPSDYLYCRPATAFESLTYGWQCGYFEAHRAEE